MQRIPGWLVAIAVFASVAGSAGAQEPAFPRPKLKSDADTNNWEEYYDYGFGIARSQPTKAEAAFYWASRLNPERAEPLFARWVAFHLRDQKRFLGYLDGREDVLRRPAVMAIDSIRLMAMVRNPFFHRGLEIVLWDELPGRWGIDDVSRGWIDYARPDFRRAVALFGRAIDHTPRYRGWLRPLRAQAFVSLRQYDSALVELKSLLAEIQGEEAKRLVIAYESKEFLQYSIGLLEDAQGHRDPAREAMSNALIENLAFYPAHLFLGDRALRAGRTADAIAEYESGLLTGSKDPVLQYRYGVALLRGGRFAEGGEALQRAVELEPFYPAPWFDLARLLDAANDSTGARAAYRKYIGRAPVMDRNAALARERLQALTR